MDKQLGERSLHVTISLFEVFVSRMVLYVSVQQGDGGLFYCYSTLLHMTCGVLLLDLLRFSECC